MDTVLSLVHPVRRGGLFGFGSSLRLDYVPGRDHSFTVGFQLPFGRTMPMGRTRPREDAVRLANPDLDPIPISPPPSALQEALENLGEAALWIHRLGVPYIEQSGWSEDTPVARAAAELEELKAHIADTGSAAVTVSTWAGAPIAFSVVRPTLTTSGANSKVWRAREKSVPTV